MTGQRNEPAHPDRVRRIVELRDHYNLPWREIADIVSKDAEQSVTHAGACWMYKRWRKWAVDAKSESNTLI